MLEINFHTWHLEIVIRNSAVCRPLLSLICKKKKEEWGLLCPSPWPPRYIFSCWHKKKKTGFGAYWSPTLEPFDKSYSTSINKTKPGRLWGILSPAPKPLRIVCLYSVPFFVLVCLGGFLQGIGHTEPLPWNPPPSFILPALFLVGFYRVWGILSPSPGTHHFFRLVQPHPLPGSQLFCALPEGDGEGVSSLVRYCLGNPTGHCSPPFLLMLVMIIGARDRSPATPDSSLVTMLCMLKHKKKGHNAVRTTEFQGTD